MDAYLQGGKVVSVHFLHTCLVGPGRDLFSPALFGLGQPFNRVASLCRRSCLRPRRSGATSQAAATACYRSARPVHRSLRYSSARRQAPGLTSTMRVKTRALRPLCPLNRSTQHFILKERCAPHIAGPIHFSTQLFQHINGLSPTSQFSPCGGAGGNAATRGAEMPTRPSI